MCSSDLSVDGETLVVHRDVNLAIAVDLDFAGLLAPVVRNADGLRLRALARSFRDLADSPSTRLAAAAAGLVAREMLTHPLPPRTFLNINVPKGEPKGMRVTVQARRNHITSVAERHDPKGRPYYWIEEGEDDWEPHDRSDYQAVRDGYVSVTPLDPDLTAHHALAVAEGYLPHGTKSRG